MTGLLPDWAGGIRRPSHLRRTAEPTSGEAETGNCAWKVSGTISDVFKRRTSTGGETFSLLICHDATKFVLQSVFTLKETIFPRRCSKSPPNSTKTPLPVDARRSKTSLLKLSSVSNLAP